MIHYVIMGIGVMASVGVVAAASLDYFQSSRAVMDEKTRAVQIKHISERLAAMATRPDGSFFMPEGEQTSNGYRLPPSLQRMAMDRSNRHAIYCPFGPVDGGSSAIANPDGSTYTVGVSGGRIVSGRPAYPMVNVNARLMGWVIMPSEPIGQAAGCNEVTWDPVTETFQAPGSIVEAVYRSRELAEMRQARNMHSTRIFVSPTGIHSGDTLTTPTSLRNALATATQGESGTYFIIMMPGTYPVEASWFQSPGERFHSPSRVIRVQQWASNDPANVVMTMSAPGDAILTGSWHFQGVSLPRNLRLNFIGPGNNYMLHAVAGAINISGGEMAMLSNDIGSVFSPAITVQSGILRMQNPNAVRTPAGGTAIQINGGEFVNIFGELYFEPSLTSPGPIDTMIELNGGSASINTATIGNVGTANYIRQRAGTSYMTNDAIFLQPVSVGYVHEGGEVMFWYNNFAATSPVAPAIGIVSNLPGMIHGAHDPGNPNMGIGATTQCWTGDAFWSADPGTATMHRSYQRFPNLVAPLGIEHYVFYPWYTGQRVVPGATLNPGGTPGEQNYARNEEVVNMTRRLNVAYHNNSDFVCRRR